MANEIGSVSVRVKPDTSKFGADAKAKLDRIERKLKVTVQAELDYRSLKSSALKALRDLNAELKTEDRYKVQFRADISETGMRAAVKKAVRELNALAKTETVEIRAEAFASKVEAELDKASLTKMNDELNRYIKRISPKTVDIVPTIVPASSLVASKRLDLIARPRVAEIVPKVDTAGVSAATSLLARLSGLRLVSGTFKEFAEMFQGIDKQIPLISSLTLAILGLAGASLAAVSDTFALSRALAQIGPAALALPGIFGGIAIGLGATVAVFKDFTKQFPKIQSQLSAIQQSMSAKFWAKAKAPIADMINTLLPQLAAGLDKTAVSLAGFFSNLANSLNGKLSGALAGMFSDLNKSIDEMAKHTDAIATIIKVLGEAGAGRLPDLAKWLGTVTDQLANFLAQAQKTGQLDAWIDLAIARLKQLGSVLVSTYKLLAGLGNAADGASPGDGLTNLADALDRVQRVVNSPGFQQGLMNLLGSAHQMMQQISQKSGPAFKKFWVTMAATLTQILPTVGDAIGTLFDGIYTALASSDVQDGIKALVKGIDSGVHSLVPAFSVLAEKTGALLQLIGAMASTFGKTFSAAVQGITPILTIFLKLMTQLVKLIGSVPQPVMKMAIQFAAAAIAFQKLQAITLLLGTTATRSFGLITTGISSVVSYLRVMTTTYMTAGAASEAQTLRVAAAQAEMKASTAGLMNGVKTLAGAGGLMLLSQGLISVKEKGVTLGNTLENTLGGAMTGLAVGGPIGALIGAGAGLGLSGLAAAFMHSHDNAIKLTKALSATQAIQQYKKYSDDLKGSLDQVTGALTAETAQVVKNDLVKSGAWKTLQQYGASGRAVVQATLGNKSALAAMLPVASKMDAQIASLKAKQDALWKSSDNIKVSYNAVTGAMSIGLTDAAKKSSNAFQDQINSITKAKGAIPGLTSDLKSAAAQVRQNTAQTRDYSGQLKGIPQKIKSQIQVEGIIPTTKGVADVAAKYKLLDKKKIKTLIQASGADTTVKQVQRVIDKLNAVGDAKPNLSSFSAKLNNQLGDAKRTAMADGQQIASGVEKPVANAKANTKKFSGSLLQQISGMKTTAQSGGSGIASYMVAGLSNGLDSGTGVLGAKGESMINMVIARMRKAADIHSPSRETYKVGDFMGQGLANGLTNTTPLVARAATKQGETAAEKAAAAAKAKKKSAHDAALSLAQNIVTGLAAGIKQNRGLVKSSLNSLLTKIPKDLTKKQSAAIKSLRKSLLDDLGTYDNVASQLKSKYDDIVSAAQSFQDQVQSTIVSLGDPTQGFGDTFAPTFKGITKNLQTAVTQAQQFQTVIDQLRSMHLNNTTLEQLMSAGPEAGLKAAQQIQQAGTSGVKQINDLQSKLAAAAKGVGQDAYDVSYQDGLNTAQGIIDGLKSQESALVDSMKKMSKKMLKAFKKAWKIHSPSRVMKQMGGYVGQGFVLGVRAKQDAAQDAVKGLGFNQLPSVDTSHASGVVSGSTTTNSHTVINVYGVTTGNTEADMFTAGTRVKAAIR